MLMLHAKRFLLACIPYAYCTVCAIQCICVHTRQFYNKVAEWNKRNRYFFFVRSQLYITASDLHHFLPLQSIRMDVSCTSCLRLFIFVCGLKHLSRKWTELFSVPIENECQSHGCFAIANSTKSRRVHLSRSAFMPSCEHFTYSSDMQSLKWLNQNDLVPILFVFTWNLFINTNRKNMVTDFSACELWWRIIFLMKLMVEQLLFQKLQICFGCFIVCWIRLTLGWFVFPSFFFFFFQLSFHVDLLLF